MDTPHAVYIAASRSRCLYTGMTDDLVKRFGQHKGVLARERGFASLYHTDRLVYYEVTPDRSTALVRERQIKGWRRAKKKALIERANPAWRDLAAAWPRIDPLPRDTGEPVAHEGRDRS